MNSFRKSNWNHIRNHIIRKTYLIKSYLYPEVKHTLVILYILFIRSFIYFVNCLLSLRSLGFRHEAGTDAGLVPTRRRADTLTDSRTERGNRSAQRKLTPTRDEHAKLTRPIWGLNQGSSKYPVLCKGLRQLIGFSTNIVINIFKRL